MRKPERTKEMNRAAARAAKCKPAGSMNVYACSACGAKIVTRDCEPGVTPFQMHCRICLSGTATSACYDQASVLEALEANEGRVTHEWYRPDNAAKVSRFVRDHVISGGLLLREVAPEKEGEEGK